MTSHCDDHCSRSSTGNGHEDACRSCTVHDLAICAPLREEELQQFGDLNHHQSFPAGAVIFEEGEVRHHVYTLVSGTIRLLKTLNDGRRCVTGFVIPGDFIGLIDSEKHILSAEAITPVTLCVFDRDRIDAYFKEHPPVRDRFLEMARAALHRSYDSQVILSRLAPIEKVARFIHDLARRMEANQFSASPLNLAMNRTDIADHLGLTIETVSRCFSKLKSQGVIRLISISKVEILDRAALKKIAAIGNEVD